MLNAGKGQSTTYYPTSTSEFASAVFQGYVKDPNDIVPLGWYGSGFDSIHIFEMHVLSTVDQTIELQIGGDDGHSLFVNGTFVGGAGFGTPVNVSLALACQPSSRSNRPIER